MRFVAFTLLASCSLTMTELPDNYDGRREPECDDGDTSPILDDVGATLLLLGALGAQSSARTDDDTGGLAFGAAGLALGLISLAGYSHASTCRRAKETYRWTRSHEREPEPERVTKSRASFYCTSAPGQTTFGYCNRTPDQCVKMQQTLAAEAGDATPCAEATVAACFDEVGIDMETRWESCHRTLGSCNRHRDEIEGKLADFRMTDCIDRRADEARDE